VSIRFTSIKFPSQWQIKKYGETLQTCLSAIITNPASIVVFGVAICFTVSLWHPLNDCREVSSTQQWVLQKGIYSLSTSKLS